MNVQKVAETKSKYSFQGKAFNKKAQQINQVVWARFRSALRALMGWLGRSSIAHQSLQGLLDLQPMRKIVLWTHERNSPMRERVERYQNAVRQSGINSVEVLHPHWVQIALTPYALHAVTHRALQTYHWAMATGEENGFSFLDTNLRQWGEAIETYYGHVRLAEEDIVKINEDLVWSAIHYMKIQEEDHLDAYQEGLMTLIEAMYRYDVAEGMTFGSYAYQWLMTRVSRAVEKKEEPLEKEGAFLESIQDQALAPEEMAERVDEYELMRAIIQQLEPPHSDIAKLFIESDDNAVFWREAIKRWGEDARRIFAEMIEQARVLLP